MTQDEMNEVWEQAFRAGFYAGFAASGEGWNGEYPFDDGNMDKIRASKSVNDKLEQALKGESNENE